MLFPTIRFAVFFGVVLAVGWRLAAWPKWWKRFVLVASYVFYGAWNPRFVLLIAFTTIANQAFAFHAISYVIDVYRGTIAPARLMDFAVYLAFFPHLVAGPIVRASELVPQLRSPRDPREIHATRAFFLIVGGLVKK